MIKCEQNKHTFANMKKLSKQNVYHSNKTQEIIAQKKTASPLMKRDCVSYVEYVYPCKKAK